LSKQEQELKTKDDKRTLFERLTFRRSGSELRDAVISLDQTPLEIFEQIKSYSPAYTYNSNSETFVALGAGISVSDDDPNNYIIERLYDDTKLNILEDCYRSDPVINMGIKKRIYSIIGKHGKTGLDTRKEFDDPDEQQKELKAVRKDKRYQKSKSLVDNVLSSRGVNLHKLLFDLLANYNVYGRACCYLVKNKFTGEVKNVILLDSKRLGRVKVDRVTLKVTAVEYLDCEKKEEGSDSNDITITIAESDTSKNKAETEPQFIPISELIYLVNDDGSVATNAHYVGYSRIEGLVHLSQVKRIILNKNLKEGAQALYAGTARVRFKEHTPDSIVALMITNLRNAIGRWFADKTDAEIEHHEFKSDIAKYVEVTDLINREMLRCLGLPSFLLGYEQIANYANSEQIMLANREMDIANEKTTLKDFIQHNILDPLFYFYLTLDTEIQTEDPRTGIKRKTNVGEQLMRQMQDSAFLIDVTTEEMELYDEQLGKDRDVKLTYDFEDINFTTKLELVQMFVNLKTIVPSLPSEPVLRALGLEGWIEEVHEAEEQAKKDKQLDFENQMKMANAQGIAKSKIGGKSPFASAVGSNADSESDEIIYDKDFIGLDASLIKDPDIKKAYIAQIEARTAAYRRIAEGK
jgi:hypothetical protein